MVAAATSNLCEAANASVQGHASEEKLISSAKQVAASTAQLLVACKVKADQDSEAMRRLQVTQKPIFNSSVETVQVDFVHANFETLCLKVAGNAVKRASDNLVRAAQKAAFDKSEDDSVVVKTKFVGGIAQVRKKILENLDVRPGTEITPVVWFCPFHRVFAHVTDMPKCQMLFF